MKPVGRERDIQIAELKGTYEVGSKDHGSIISDRMYWCGENDKGIDPLWPRENGFPITCPKWSTSRNDAWELWDELPQGKSFIDGAEPNYCIITVYFNKQSKAETFSGKDFADCISQAWITWKGMDN